MFVFVVDEGAAVQRMLYAELSSKNVPVSISLLCEICYNNAFRNLKKNETRIPFFLVTIFKFLKIFLGVLKVDACTD